MALVAIRVVILDFGFSSFSAAAAAADDDEVYHVSTGLVLVTSVGWNLFLD
jgi:hypothetical protein